MENENPEPSPQDRVFELVAACAVTSSGEAVSTPAPATIAAPTAPEEE